MKKTIKTAAILAIAFIGLTALSLTGCDNGTGDDNVPVTGVTLDRTTLALTVGGADTLTVDIMPSNATNTNVTWSTSNASVATVNNGTVTAVAVGTATITVTTADGNKTDSCAVTVTAGGAPVAVTDITLDKTTLALTVGEHDTLHQTVAPANATNKAVTWSTSNDSVATVNNGIVTAVAAGTATITVTTVDGSKTASCAVTVSPTPVVYAVGDEGPAGGIIIYVSASGFNVAGLGTCHYLEAAPDNQSTGVTWSGTKVYVTGATETGIGKGKANTAAIIADHPYDTEANNAAKAAAAYTGGSETDWFLPSKDELNAMYEARTHLGISSDFFWSSSQYNINNAQDQDFNDGFQSAGDKGNAKTYVRAVRAF